MDTPGQIEIFTWSASGAIITEAFASTFPTVIAYVVDTPRSESPTTFMSNMLYACSILYKTRLPMVLVFNKTDVAKHQFALEVKFLPSVMVITYLSVMHNCILKCQNYFQLKLDNILESFIEHDSLFAIIEYV